MTGKTHWVQLGAGTDHHDDFIDPEERLRIAMVSQSPTTRSRPFANSGDRVSQVGSCGRLVGIVRPAHRPYAVR